MFPGTFYGCGNLFVTYNFYALLRNLANMRKAIYPAKYKLVLPGLYRSDSAVVTHTHTHTHTHTQTQTHTQTNKQTNTHTNTYTNKVTNLRQGIPVVCFSVN